MLPAQVNLNRSSRLDRRYRSILASRASFETITNVLVSAGEITLDAIYQTFTHRCRNKATSCRSCSTYTRPSHGFSNYSP